MYLDHEMFRFGPTSRNKMFVIYLLRRLRPIELINHVRQLDSSGAFFLIHSFIMGLLYVGTPLEWCEVKQYAEHVRTHGITQFLYTWDRLKDRHGDELLWGDEVPKRLAVLLS